MTGSSLKLGNAGLTDSGFVFRRSAFDAERQNPRGWRLSLRLRAFALEPVRIQLRVFASSSSARSVTQELMRLW